jgi:hypothetical protein
MFPIAEDALSLRDISDYWSREINPPASWEELFHVLEAAWWLGELRGDFVHTPLQLLKNMFTSMRHRDDLGVVFLVGNSAGPLPIELPDGSVTLDIRPEIRVPSGDTEDWNETSCRGAFQALAETRSLDRCPELAEILSGMSLSYGEFTAWVEKRGFTRPTFWQPRRHPPKKRWKAKPGQKKLTRTEEAILSVINEVFPDGKLAHNAKYRNERINQHLASSGKVTPRTIQRTLEKIEFA